MTTPNPFLDFLDVEPQAAYQSYRDKWGGPERSQTKENYYQDQFTKIHDAYMGTLGFQARQGTMPMGSFNDYLGGFGWEDWYRQRVPYDERNRGFGNFAPSLRWDVGPRNRGTQG